MLGIFAGIRGKEIEKVLRPRWSYLLNALNHGLAREYNGSGFVD